MAKEAHVEGPIINKTRHQTTIFQMILASVPKDVMMKITRHKSANSLDRCDDTLDGTKEAAMQSLDSRLGDFQVNPIFFIEGLCY